MPQPVPSTLNFSSTTTTAKPAAPPAPEPMDKTSFRTALGEAKKKQPDAKRASEANATSAARRSGKSATKRQVAKLNSPAGGKKPVADSNRPESDSEERPGASASDQSTPQDPEPDKKRAAKAPPRPQVVEPASVSTPAALVEIKPSGSPQAPDLQARTAKNEAPVKDRAPAAVKPLDPQRASSPKDADSDRSPTAADSAADGSVPQAAQQPAESQRQDPSLPASDNPPDAADGGSRVKSSLAVQPKATSPAKAPQPPDYSAGNPDVTEALAALDVGSNDDNALPRSAAATEPTTPASRTLGGGVNDPSITNPQQQTGPSLLRAETAPSRTSVAEPAPSQQPAEAQFAEANHATIVTAIHGQLLPNGGSMHVRLDPPELGAMHIRVEMRDGVMTASFETSSDQATKLLSHSLGDLKTALEAQGVSIDRLHVRQSPKEQSSSGDGRQDDRDRQQEQTANQEQQRREMLRQMWRRLMKNQGPLDLVA